MMIQSFDEDILTLHCSKPIPGNFVTIKKKEGFRQNKLILCEVNVDFERDKSKPIFYITLTLCSYYADF